MNPKLTLSTTIAILTLSSCLLAEEIKYPPINPALTYWQSAALMPDLKGEKGELLKDTISGKRPFNEAKVHELLSESDGALRLFAKAADSAAPCDWGLPVEDGPEMPLPHVSKVMELSRLALLKADSLFAEGKNSEGIGWLLTIHRAARHAGAGDLLISALVQFTIEASAIGAGAGHCLGWDEATREQYADGLKALPPLHNLHDAYRGEMILTDWIERHALSTDPKLRQELVEEILRAIQSGSRPKIDMAVETRKLQDQLTPEKGPKFIAELRDLNRRSQEAMGKPWKESREDLEAIANEVQQGDNLLKLTFAETSENIGGKQFGLATLRTMLDAALQYGPKLDEAAAATYKDAFNGEPLVLKRGGDDSLTLTTARQYRKGIELKLGK